MSTYVQEEWWYKFSRCLAAFPPPFYSSISISTPLDSHRPMYLQLVPLPPRGVHLPQSIRHHAMPGHLRLDLALRTQDPDRDAQQHRCTLCEPVLIAPLRGIVVVSRRIQRRRLRGVPIEERLRHGDRHAIRPQIVQGPVVGRLLAGTLLARVVEDVVGGGGHGARGVAGVEEGDEVVAAGERAAPELELALAVAVESVGGGVVAPDADGGDAEGVLVDGEEGRVVEDGEVPRRQGVHVGAHQEGRFDRRPHGEVGLVFVIGHAAVADFEGVQVVPGVRDALVDVMGDLVEDVHGGAVEAGEGTVVVFGAGAGAARVRPVEGVVDVAAHAPAVGDSLRPFPRVVFAPIAHGVEDLSASRVESVGHLFIAFVGDQGIAALAFVVAVVVLEVVDAPIGEGLGILLFVVEGAGVAGTGVGASGAVHAKFEAFVVNTTCHFGHAVGEPGEVGLEGAVVASAV